jgi:L-fuculose-phosphate aldolase
MPDVITPTKESHHEKFRADMERWLQSADWTVRERVALTSRMLHRDGHDSALAGQISTRGERPGTYWALSFGLGFDEIRAANVLLIDDTLEVLSGDGMPNPANRFHLWIYRARPEVNAIVHTHAPYASALSLTGVPLDISHMDTCVLYENCAHLPEWPGVPIGDDEGRIISEALGDKPAVLLGHHGLLTATENIERAAVLAFYLERAARMQLLARTLGPIRKIDPELAREARDYRGSPKYISATFNYLARCALRDSPECLS